MDERTRNRKYFGRLAARYKQVARRGTARWRSLKPPFEKKSQNSLPIYILNSLPLNELRRKPIKLYLFTHCPIFHNQLHIIISDCATENVTIGYGRTKGKTI
jgi:hypothetical protein